MSPLLISCVDLLYGFFFFFCFFYPPPDLGHVVKKKRHECAHQNLIVYIEVYTLFCSVWHQLTDGTAITQNQSEKYDFCHHVLQILPKMTFRHLMNVGRNVGAKSSSGSSILHVSP